MNPDWIERPLDWLLGYTPGMKLPLAGTKFDRQWHPEDAFRVRPTEDTHWSWVGRHKRGIDNMIFAIGDRRERRDTRLMNKARRLVRHLICTGVVDMSDVNPSDTDRAEEAMAYAVMLIKDGKADNKSRLAAAGLVLAFCRAKPATRAEVTINKAEAFLDELDE